MTRRSTRFPIGAALSVLLASGCNATPHAARDAGPGHDSGTIDIRGADVGFFERIDAGVGFQNSLGPAVTAAFAPPAISGGTLLTSGTAPLAFVSDPDDDRIVVVDTTSRVVLGTVSLSSHDEPGRLALDSRSRLFVVLRGAGAIVTVDVSTPAAPVLVERRVVCPVPRGIAYDAVGDRLYVACAGGELVVLPPTGAPLRTFSLPDDLRDVVIDGASLLVTRFRSAQVLVVDPASGAITRTISMPSTTTSTMMPVSAGVAWRAIARPGGGALLVHQLASDAVLDPSMPGAYGGRGCEESIVQSTLSLVAADAEVGVTPTLPCTPLPVDVAVSADGHTVAVASAGSLPVDSLQFHVYSLDTLASVDAPTVDDLGGDVSVAGRVVAVAFAAAGGLVVQTRAPAALHFVVDGSEFSVPLGGADHTDTGLDVFYSNVGGGIACASCHPEAGDDGRVWHFLDAGPRRTIPLRGGVSHGAPYHWRGEFAAMSDLLADVFGVRMSGGALVPDYQAALLAWLDAVPELAVRTPSDPAAVARGQALFESAEVGCTSCHSGELGSNELTMDVGTGGAFQVPSLHGVAYRAPYLHDGRAATLLDRFTPIGGGDAHGHTSQLDATQLADLVAYLETL